MGSPKQLILTLLKRERDGIRDNQIRSKAQFKRLSLIDMYKPYGFGSETPRQILRQYDRQMVEIDDAIAWIKRTY